MVEQQVKELLDKEDDGSRRQGGSGRSRDPLGRFMAMLTAVFDASGNESDQSCVTVAGFVSDARQWKEFEAEWKMALGDLPYFRATEHKRIPGLIDRLAAVIRPRVWRKVSVSLTTNTILLIPSAQWASHNINAYAMCARTCVTEVERWALYRGYPRDKIDYVFAAGDVGAGLLKAAMEQDGLRSPILRYPRDVVIKGRPHAGLVSLQAADLFAHVAFDTIRGLRVGEASRLPYPDLDKIYGEPGIITREDIEHFAEMTEAIRRMGISVTGL